MRNLITISAPSGAGKTTICRALQKHPDVEFSVSCTTRSKRDYETDGVDYYFLSHEEFQHRIENGDFAETENVHGYMYGTLKETLEEAIITGKILLFEVDVKGAMSIKNLYPEQTVSIFILPPSIEDLRRRLVKRGSDSEERIIKRLERLAIEIDYQEKFDFTVTNDDVDRAQKEIISIINAQNEGVLYGS